MVKEFVRFLDGCLLIGDVLVIGDMHIGYEESVGKGLLPRVQIKDILEKLGGVFEVLDGDDVKLKKIVLLGDLKHEFGGISDSEWRGVLVLLDYLSSKCKEIILIKGNHDNILKPIARKRNIKLRNYYKIKMNVEGKGVDGRRVDVCFLHGHECFKQCLNSDILIMGHLHPSISLKDKYKNEKFKCFLRGKWKRKDVYILPSFSEISLGYDLRDLDFEKEDSFIFIDDRSLRNFEVLIYNDKEKKVLGFGGLGGLV